MHIPDGDFQAYLFDCDGTVADSMPLHYKAWNQALGQWGGRFEKDLFFAWAGIPLPRTVEMLNEKYGWKVPVADAVARKEAIYLELLPTLKAVPEVLKHIELHHGKIPFAIVSGSPRESVFRTLSVLGLLERFETIVGGDDCPRGKPAPDPFLLAAKRLGVEPAKCLVFEDGELGIQGAEAAGMRWVRVPVDARGY